MSVDGACVDVSCDSPYSFQKNVPCEQAALILEQEQRQIEILIGQGQEFAVQVNAALIHVDLEGAEHQQLFIAFRVAAACQSVQSGDEFRSACWLCQEIVCTGIERTNNVTFAIVLGQEYRRNSPVEVSAYAFKTSMPVMSGICQSRMIRS